MKYKALKDVPYWDIKAGEVYEESIQGYLLTTRVTCKTKPLLEAGIIKECESDDLLTKNSEQTSDEYLYLFYSGADISDFI